MPTITDFTDTADREKSRRSGQTICEHYRAAKAAGAPFTGNTKEDILDELITGVTGELVPTFFTLSLADEEKAGALAYCSYDAATETLKYHPEGGQAGDGSDGWTDWAVWPAGSAFSSEAHANSFWASLGNDPSWEHRVLPDPNYPPLIPSFLIEWRQPL